MRVNKPKPNQKGFTLVEIMLAMAILTFVLLIVASGYLNIARLYYASTAARNLQQNNRFATEQITRVARTSTDVVISPSGAAPVSICFTSQGNQVFYIVPDVNDPNKNTLYQATSLNACSALDLNNLSNAHTITTPGSYVAKWTADSSAPGAITFTIWMASRTDLLNTVSGLQCNRGPGTEFCAINKLTTTVRFRGEN